MIHELLAVLHTWLSFADACRRTARLCGPSSQFSRDLRLGTHNANDSGVYLVRHLPSNTQYDALRPNHWQYNPSVFQLASTRNNNRKKK